MTRIAVGFGSNLGDRRSHLDAARAAIATHARLVRSSSLYESAPIGPVDQAPFLNAVAVFETDDEPGRVLDLLLSVEQSRGRVRDVRWGPRTLDLDLLLYGLRSVDQANLTIPHPELAKRRFVLEPLLEVWPGASLPDGTSLTDFLPGVEDQQMARIGDWPVASGRRLWWWMRRTVRRNRST